MRFSPERQVASGYWNFGEWDQHLFKIKDRSGNNNQALLMKEYSHLEYRTWKPCAFWIEPGQEWEVQVGHNLESASLMVSSMELCHFIDLQHEQKKSVELCGRSLAVNMNPSDSKVYITMDLNYEDESYLLGQTLKFKFSSNEWSDAECISVPGTVTEHSGDPKAPSTGCTSLLPYGKKVQEPEQHCDIYFATFFG